MRAQGSGATPLPPDREASLAAALAGWGLPCTAAVAHADRVLYGLAFDQMRFGVVEALAAQADLPHDDRPVSVSGAPLVPLSYPRLIPEVWCDAGGAMYMVLYDLGVCEPTYDSAEHLLECQALQRVYLPERDDRFGFETQAYLGAEAAQALGLPVLPEVEGTRCHAWSDARGVVVEARIEQYLYGTYVGLRDGAEVAALLSALPDEKRRHLRIIRGPGPTPDDEARIPDQVYVVEIGEIHTYRRGDAVTAAYHPRKYGAA